jgi:uncharacterized membrane protein YkoI
MLIRHLIAAATVTLLSQAVFMPAALAREARGLAAAALAEGMTLEQAVAEAEKKHSARAVRADEQTQDGRRVYRIRLLSTDGRVFDVTVDAASGRIE